MSDLMAMGMVCRVHYIQQDPPNLLRGEGALPAELRPQGFAGDEGHDIEWGSFAIGILDHPGRQHRNDVRVLEPGGMLHLAPESLAAAPRHEIGRKNLDDDFPLEQSVVRDEDARHAPGRKLAGYDQAFAQPLLEVRPDVFGHR